MFTSAKDTTAKNNMANEGGRTADDFKEGLRRVKNDVRDAAETVKGDVDSLAHETGRQVREFADSLGHNVSDAVGSVTTKVRDEPIKSILITLGIGFVVGSLFRR